MADANCAQDFEQIKQQALMAMVLNGVKPDDLSEVMRLGKQALDAQRNLAVCAKHDHDDVSTLVHRKSTKGNKRDNTEPIQISDFYKETKAFPLSAYGGLISKRLLWLRDGIQDEMTDFLMELAAKSILNLGDEGVFTIVPMKAQMVPLSTREFTLAEFLKTAEKMDGVDRIDTGDKVPFPTTLFGRVVPSVLSYYVRSIPTRGSAQAALNKQLRDNLDAAIRAEFSEEEASRFLRREIIDFKEIIRDDYAADDEMNKLANTVRQSFYATIYGVVKKSDPIGTPMLELAREFALGAVDDADLCNNLERMVKVLDTLFFQPDNDNTYVNPNDEWLNKIGFAGLVMFGIMSGCDFNTLLKEDDDTKNTSAASNAASSAAKPSRSSRSLSPPPLTQQRHEEAVFGEDDEAEESYDDDSMGQALATFREGASSSSSKKRKAPEGAEEEEEEQQPDLKRTRHEMTD